VLSEKGLTDGELDRFFASVSEEAGMAMIDVWTVKAAFYIVAARDSHGAIVGLAGIRRSARLPALFVMVRKDWQRVGVGRALTERVVDISFRRYGFLTLSTYDAPRYLPAISMYRKLGFEEICRRGEKIWMAVSVGFRGALWVMALKVLYPMFLLIRGRHGVRGRDSDRK